MVASPAPALAAGHPTAAHTTPQITPTAPSRLTTSTSSTTTTGAPAATTTTGTGTGTSTVPSGNLPNTGLNLLPETVAGLLLLATGVGMRVRRSRA